MCGLIGFLPKDDVDIDIDKVNTLIEASRVRGQHATGYFIFNSPQDYVLRKESGTDLLLPYDIMVEKSKLILGHVRKATKGCWLDNQANHPHKCGNFVVIHNGTVTALQNISESYNINKADSDSYSIVALINHCVKRFKMSTEEAIATVMSNAGVNDSFAIALFDMNNQDLYMFRNYQRPIILLPSLQGLVLSSEAKFIEHLYETAAPFGCPSTKSWELPVKEIWKININNKYLEKVGSIPATAVPLSNAKRIEVTPENVTGALVPINQGPSTAQGKTNSNTTAFPSLARVANDIDPFDNIAHA